jgi:hypothetical protein
MACDFKTGDRITGLACNGYSITNEDMYEAEVIEASDYNDEMKIKIIRHELSSKIGRIERVSNSAKRFKKLFNEAEAAEAKKSDGGSVGMNFKGIMKDFGTIKDGSVAITFDGKLAIKTTDGYVIYDAAKGTLINQMEMVVKDANFLYILPVDKVVEGDIIKQNSNFYYVIGINDHGGINAVKFADGTIDVLVKGTNLFGMNFFYKVVNPLSQFGLKADGGFNPMMFMIMDKDSGSDMKDILLMQMLTGGSTEQAINPMMLFAMGDDKLDAKTMLLFSMLNKSDK